MLVDQSFTHLMSARPLTKHGLGWYMITEVIGMGSGEEAWTLSLMSLIHPLVINLLVK